MPRIALSTIAPQDFRALGGFLGQRFQVNREVRLKDPMLSEQFIRLHERKDHHDWFWLGEQLGKWLDASAYAALIAQDDGLLARVQQVLERLARSQEGDGYLGIATRRQRIPVRGMELYEMYYMLHGLLTCADLLKSDIALETARRLGDYVIRAWGPDPGQFPLAGRFPGNGHDGGEGTLILEPIVLLGQRTGDARYIEWGERGLKKWDEWLRTYPESNFTCDYTAMRQFAAGEKQVYQLRENIHSHTFHMTLLGVAALYDATGNREYQDVVIGCVDRLAEEWILLTGGMSSGERYVPRRFYHPRADVEVCPQHTWILLLEQVLKWTGEARYSAEIERDLFNHFLAAQLSDGSNWSYMTPLNGQAQKPKSPNCCNSSGSRIAGRMPTYLYGLRGGAPAVLLYSESTVVLHPPELPAITMHQETDFPSNGSVIIRVEPDRAAVFPVHMRIPSYAIGATAQVRTDGNQSTGAPVSVQAGEFLVIEREWKLGDSIKLSLPLPVTCKANDHLSALMRGPLVYAYFQDAQADPVVYHGQRGRYPEDVVIRMDPDRLSDSVQEEPAPEGLLGPALRVSGHSQAGAPIFAASEADHELPGKQETSLLLLPFANQGAVRGEYAVFLQYV